MSDGSFDPISLIDALIAHQVEFVIIGGIAGTIHGSDIITSDLDICYRRSSENIEKLVRTLTLVGVTLRGAPPGLPFILDERTIRNGDSFTFDTPAGSFDCIGTPSGTNGYDDLIRSAVLVYLDGRAVKVCSLDDLIRMKRAAARAKDLWSVEQLMALRKLIEDGSDPE